MILLKRDINDGEYLLTAEEGASLGSNFVDPEAPKTEQGIQMVQHIEAHNIRAVAFTLSKKGVVPLYTNRQLQLPAENLE